MLVDAKSKRRLYLATYIELRYNCASRVWTLLYTAVDIWARFLGRRIRRHVLYRVSNDEILRATECFVFDSCVVEVGRFLEIRERAIARPNIINNVN